MKTQRVTWRPFSRHFSGLGSFFLQLRKATFSGRHRTAMCLDAAISTDDVGIGSPEASTGVLVADISAGAGGLAVEIWEEEGGEMAKGRTGDGEGRLGAGGAGAFLSPHTPLSVRFVGFFEYEWAFWDTSIILSLAAWCLNLWPGKSRPTRGSQFYSSSKALFLMSKKKAQFLQKGRGQKLINGTYSFTSVNKELKGVREN